MQKTALITGITGQDGAILAETLLEKGYKVHGMRTYSPVPDKMRIDHLEDISLHYGDLCDGCNITRLLDQVQPDEIYNMAALSHVHVSFEVPEITANINALGPVRLLEAMRMVGGEQQMRFYQASSSEMFGRSHAPQNEETVFQPCSPYGTAKLYAYWMVRNYRETYGLYASNGILFNHESALRGEEFVTRKITKAIGEIQVGQLDKLILGNLNSKRDWGHARDYMQGVWSILQQPDADDFVLATGKSYSVRQFVEVAFACIGTDLRWEGEGAEEKGFDRKTGKVLVEVDPKLFRPKEVHNLLGDATKAQKQLGWQPKISFEQMVAEMIEADSSSSKYSNCHVA